MTMKKISKQLWRKLFAENLKEIMQERDLTQNDIAKMAGVSQSFMSRILSAKSSASVKVVVNLSYSLRIKMDKLCVFEELLK